MSVVFIVCFRKWVVGHALLPQRPSKEIMLDAVWQITSRLDGTDEEVTRVRQSNGRAGGTFIRGVRHDIEVAHTLVGRQIFTYWMYSPDEECGESEAVAQRYSDLAQDQLSYVVQVDDEQYEIVCEQDEDDAAEDDA